MDYQALIETHRESFKKQSKQYTKIALLRLLICLFAITSIYFYFTKEQWIHLLFVLVLFVFFLVLVKWTSNILWKRKLASNQIKINEDELKAHGNEPFLNVPNGERFIDFEHDFSYDLDVFGENSLYHYLNRTSTVMGAESLRDALISDNKSSGILLLQKGVQELAKNIQWRQKFNAIAMEVNDSSSQYEQLKTWINKTSKPLSKVSHFFIFSLSLFPGLSFITYFLTGIPAFHGVGWLLCLVNLGVLILFIKKIKNNIISSNKIYRTIHRYALLLREIENVNFDSKLLKKYQSQIAYNDLPSSTIIQRLSRQVDKLNGFQNALGAFIFNSLFLIHIHALKELLDWKKQYGHKILDWLEVIGKMEALSSIANFAYNKPEYPYPTINSEMKLDFKELGHPLIKPTKCIHNSISFHPHSFVILTGSNMSGKSTFLRALGINLILSKVGAPVCSKVANVHPLPMVATMRHMDSLSKGNSYFFSEIQKLKRLSDRLENSPCIVLMDEILKGTNSEDKVHGTREVIRKILSKEAIGIAATHDIQVCELSLEYPEILCNKCFESIIDNESISFDYTLREGICKSKNATFLLKKYKIIN